MVAHFRCFSPETGNVEFDLNLHTTRFVGAVLDNSTEGSIAVNHGGGTVFWVLLDDDIHENMNNYGEGRFASTKLSQINVEIRNNIIHYRKPPAVKFMYGVYV